MVLHRQDNSLQSLVTLLIFLFWPVSYAYLVYKFIINFWKRQDTQVLLTLKGVFPQFAAFLTRFFGQ